MKLVIDLPDDDFTPDHRRLVREALGYANEDELSAAMQKLGKAAIMEYIGMFVEKGMPSRADEARQNRLYFMIRHYYETRIPPESEVSSVFQLTQSHSRTLLRNTRYRYRTRIGSQVQASAKAVVASATLNASTERWEMVIHSEVILEELNFVITVKAPTLKTVTLKRGSAGQYEAEQDTYQLLRTEYGV
ncbi:MAG TPA: hypothetical protein VNM87_01935 [Candidatus Udaeobacter sp.]|nr:hypothetical protein [Candidatus Udaeobacter sp.]